MWHTGTGKIVYNPFRGSMKRRTAWWCVMNVDNEIANYYRWWVKKEYHLHRLVAPSWGAHVSVIRGEKPRDDLMHLWKKYDGKVVEFRYKNCPYRAKKSEFWIIDVDAPELINIRKEFEIPHDWSLHLTIGKEKY